MENKGYEMNDLIGHGGLEEALEDALRGADGIKQVEYGKDGTHMVFLLPLNQRGLDPF